MLTAAAATIAAITGLWNTVQIGRLTGRLDTLTAQVNAHVNAPGLHAPDPRRNRATPSEPRRHHAATIARTGSRF